MNVHSHKVVMYIQKLHHFYNNPPLIMAHGWAESSWEITNNGSFINQYHKIDTTTRKGKQKCQ